MAKKFGLNELLTTTQEEDHESGFSNATNQNNDYGDEVKTTTNLLNIVGMSMHTTFNIIECLFTHTLLLCYYVNAMQPCHPSNQPRARSISCELGTTMVYYYSQEICWKNVP
jgi:hypothetical protein